MTRPPFLIQLVAEVLVGIFILVLSALPSKIEMWIRQTLHFLVEDCQKNLPLGWTGPLLVVCFVFFGAVLWLSTLPKQ